MSAPEPARAVVLGRYAGVVEVLAGILRAGGVEVQNTWAANTDGGDPPLPPQGAVVVTPVSPGDDTLDRLRARGHLHRVVGVSWHPADEQPDPPGPATIVQAGAITATLAATVTAAATGQDSASPSSRSPTPM